MLREALILTVVAILVTFADPFAAHATDGEAASLDEPLGTIDLSGANAESRLGAAMDQAFATPEQRTKLPWLDVFRGKDADRPMAAEDRAGYASRYLPAVGTVIGGRKVTALKARSSGAWLTYAATAHFRIVFEDAPDLWIQTFGANDRGLSWADGVMLSQRLAGNPRPISGSIIEQASRQWICLNDGDSPALVVCATTIRNSQTVLSAMMRADTAGALAIKSSEQRLITLLSAAAPDLELIGVKRPSAAESDRAANGFKSAAWIMSLLDLLPEPGDESGIEAITPIENKTKTDAFSYLGAVAVKLKSGELFEVLYFEKPLQADAIAIPFQVVTQERRTSGRSASTTYKVGELPLHCIRGEFAPTVVRATCGLFDPLLPRLILAADIVYDGGEDQPIPKQSLQSAVDDLLDLRRRIVDWQLKEPE